MTIMWHRLYDDDEIGAVVTFAAAATSVGSSQRPTTLTTAKIARILLFNLGAFLFVTLIVFGDVVKANSNLALLSGTLKTFQAYACDGDSLSIRCPHGTTISVQVAQYGLPVAHHHVCPPRATDDTFLVAQTSENVSCLASDTLKVVVAACQEKRQCKVMTAPKTFGLHPDPCPGIKKFAEVAYKCRPHEFITKVICERDQLHLKCRKGSRIAIYSASFGRTLHGNVECPQPDGVAEEDCLASYSTEAVMRICHGKRKCTMMADIQTFGNPCADKSRSYLKVVYTCVPTRILKNMYQNGGDGDDYEGEGEAESEGDEELVDEPSYRLPPTSKDDVEERISKTAVRPTKESKKKNENLSKTSQSLPTLATAPISTTKDIQGDFSEEDFGAVGVGSDDSQVNCTVVAKTDDVVSVGVVTEWISAFNFLRGNKEKLILYLTVSISTGLIVFMFVVIIRLIYQKRRERKRAKLNISEPLPNGFCDDFSDIDQDITDLSHVSPQRQDPNVAVVRYTNRSTMRRQDSDTNPRAPITRSHNNFYYS